MSLNIGSLSIELIEANIHSDDATVFWIKELGILLAGDTMEDTVTFVAEPQNFAIHLADLDRLAALNAKFILPNHGDPDIIASGGYGSEFIEAQKHYIQTLVRCRHELGLREKLLEDLISEPLSMGWVKLFEPYREIHAENLMRVVAMDK